MVRHATRCVAWRAPGVWVQIDPGTRQPISAAAAAADSFGSSSGGSAAISSGGTSSSSSGPVESSKVSAAKGQQQQPVLSWEMGPDGATQRLLSTSSLMPTVDLVVSGVVVVGKNGVRLGKGKGFAEREWALFREMGALRVLEGDSAASAETRTLVCTTCHDLQFIDDDDHSIPSSVPSISPAEHYMNPAHDLPVDLVCTNSGKVHRCGRYFHSS